MIETENAKVGLSTPSPQSLDLRVQARRGAVCEQTDGQRLATDCCWVLSGAGSCSLAGSALSCAGQPPALLL
jgi:hypothetical protein